MPANLHRIDGRDRGTHSHPLGIFDRPPPLTTLRGGARSPGQNKRIKQAIEALVLTSSEPGALWDHDLLEL
jgi:hypothetical protein